MDTHTSNINVPLLINVEVHKYVQQYRKRSDRAEGAIKNNSIGYVAISHISLWHAYKDAAALWFV